MYNTTPLKTTKFSLYKGKYISKSFPYPSSILVLASLFLFLLSSFFLNSNSTNDQKDQIQRRFFICPSSKSHWSVNPINQIKPKTSEREREREREREIWQKCPPHPLMPFHRTTSPPPNSSVTSIATSVTLSLRYLLISFSLWISLLLYDLSYPFAPTIFFLFFFNGFLYVLGLVFLCVLGECSLH